MSENFIERELEFQDVSVLVVEDSEMLRSIVTNVLVEMGVGDIRYAATPAEALREFVHRAAHVVIVEFGSDFSGACSLIRKLRISPYWKRGIIGLVGLLPQANRDRIRKARKAGAEAIVAEPFALGELAEHIRVIIHRHYHAAPSGNHPDGISEKVAAG